jgi:hypothetical protein
MLGSATKVRGQKRLRLLYWDCGGTCVGGPDVSHVAYIAAVPKLFVVTPWGKLEKKTEKKRLAMPVFFVISAVVVISPSIVERST